MIKEDVKKLLGGYATGTLTAQERTRLFEAALADQTLFNALADEQALKELLDNPHARRRLLATLRAQSSRPPLLSQLRRWLLPPAVRAIAGGLAVALLAVTTVTRLLDIAPSPSVVTEDAHRAAPGRAVLEDRRAVGTKDFAPKKSKRQEPMDILEKAAREADAQQNKDEERRTAAAPEPEMRLSEPPSVAASPEAKRTPAAQPPAKAASGAPVPSQQSLARAKADRPAEIGSARDLFYKSASSELAKEKVAPALPEERIAGFGGLARPAVQRLGIRYGMVPREEGPALVVEVNQRGYLYAVARDADGAAILVSPAFLVDLQAALVEPGARYFIPPLGALASARLTIVLSRVPLADPAAMVLSGQSGKKDALLRQETPEPPLEGVSGPTVYVVEASPSSSVLFVEIVAPAR